MPFEKIAAKDITEALATAMERADKMRTVIVIYDTTEEYEKESGGKTHGVIINDDCTLSAANFLLDIGKKWVLE